MEKLLFVLAFGVVLVICFAQGYTAQMAQNERVARKSLAREGTVLGTSVVAAQLENSPPTQDVSLKQVAVGMTLLELGLDPERRDHWLTATKVVEAQLEQLDSVELIDRGLLHVSDVDTDPVIELPSRDPVEISEVDGVTI